MSGLSAAAVSLATALVLLPCSSRRRLVAARLLASRQHVTTARTRAMAVCAVGTVAAAVLPIAVTCSAATLLITLTLRRRRRAVRGCIEQESGAMEAALDVVVGELRVGAHPVSAFRVAAAEADGTIADSFRAVAARAELGADVSGGLFSAAAAAVRPAYWERLAVCWDLAETHGLTMATLVRAAQRDIVERAQFDSQVSAGMAGARATAALLAGLPLAGVALGELLGAQPIRFLLSGGAGSWLLMIGVSLVCCGLTWADRITSGALS